MGQQCRAVVNLETYSATRTDLIKAPSGGWQKAFFIGHKREVMDLSFGGKTVLVAVALAAGG